MAEAKTNGNVAPHNSSRFEVVREKRQGPPQVEEYLGLDRARAQALGYALDGPRGPYSGRVQVAQVIYVCGRRAQRRELDLLDERVASIFLYGVELPRAW